jgi:hypothetical protein
MVFTVPVRNGGGGGRTTRRALLAGVAGAAGTVALTGCWPGRKSPAANPTPHPLTPVLAGTTALVGMYQAAITAYADLGDKLRPLLDDHRKHVEALRQAMGLAQPSGAASGSAAPSASAGASVAPDPDAALKALHDAEQAGRTAAATACLAASNDDAALVGSIAACRATHVEVLSP